MVTFGDILKYTILQVKTALATFWAIVGKIGPHCSPTSGHSGPLSPLLLLLLLPAVHLKANYFFRHGHGSQQQLATYEILNKIGRRHVHYICRADEASDWLKRVM